MIAYHDHNAATVVEVGNKKKKTKYSIHCDKLQKKTGLLVLHKKKKKTQSLRKVFCDMIHHSVNIK